MDLVASELEELLSRTNYKLNSVKEELAQCPDGSLMSAKVNGNPGYFRVEYPDGKRKRTLISRDQTEVAALLRKDYLQSQAELLSGESDALNKALEQVRAMPVPVSGLLNKHKWLSEELLSAAQSGIWNGQVLGQRGMSDALRWANAKYDKYDRFAEYRRHRTSRGLMVRSKSEVLIAEALYEAGIPFRYEQLLYIGNVSYAPDFTILRADGKIFYWEHQGLMSDPVYFERYFSKIRAYFSEGIVPWDNLILTYDSFSGSIDIRDIHAQIEQKLLI